LYLNEQVDANLQSTASEISLNGSQKPPVTQIKIKVISEEKTYRDLKTIQPKPVFTK
jgi:hypothetical protein